MNDERFGMLEFDDEVPTPEPKPTIFVPAGGLQVREGATAKQDANGTWFNAIGLESSETHRHVSKIWQDKCTPLSDFIATVKKQAENKRDIVKPESEVRLKDANTLVDGMPLTDSGLNSLRMFTDIPSSMISFMKEREYNEELTRIFNDELNHREEKWANDGKEPRDFRIRIRHDDDGNDIIRAIVSEKYGVIDNYEAMEMIADALPSLKDALASHISNDGDDIFGNVLLPDHMKSEPDSDYGVGIAFRNSEIRNATLKVSPFLFRAICLNGMIWGRSNSEITINQKHMGNINSAKIRKEIQHAVTVALTQGDSMLTLLGHSKKVKVENPLAVIAQLTRDQKMTTEQGRAWHRGYLDSLDEGNGHLHENTAFGVVNGLTRSAQFFKGATREQMETYSSYILSPSIDADLQSISKRWGRIADNASQLGEKIINQYQYVAV
jgi:Domain of unknown function (DUF932)